ncbi:MAG: MBL fold metallo-hydrolase [Candidatus Dadabacteria bacterium]|nr:MBL fold metallo-hydrolase [Candidatus Dadabacteria bacterium]NIQ16463.1 MBL fold metallo-hydrolase [Candidatus Dadabacteria bacterium]
MNLKIIDVNFFAPEVIASYLIETDDGPILIETGPDSTYQNLVKGLDDNGYKVYDVKHVLVTHIHLDHSGAAWHFAKEGSKIYVHERGAPHLIAPERLMKSAAMIYGDKMDELWGEVQGMEEDRVQVAKDGDKLNFGGVEITVHESPGHANHHNSYQVEGALFTGDVAGCRIGDGPVIPPTPPPDIHIERWHASIDKIRQINPDIIYPTHFGGYTDIKEHLDELLSELDRWTEWMGPRVKEGKSEEEITKEFSEYYKEIFKRKGSSEETFEKYESADPYWMNVGGLVRYWNKYRLSEN